MKHSTLKRWVFAALLSALIAGTILGHAHVPSPECVEADRSHRMSLEDSSAAWQQKLGEIAKRKQTHAANISAEESALAGISSEGLIPFDIIFFARP